MDRSSLFSHLTPFSKLLFLLMIIFMTYLATLFLGFLAGLPFFGLSFFEQLGKVDYSDPSWLPLLKYFQMLSQLGFFVFPAFLFAYLMHGKVTPYLLMDQRPDYLTIFLSCVLLIISMPAINWLIEMNAAMQLPDSAENIESWMRESETEAETLTKAFLSSSTWKGFSVNILMMVLLPSLGEELIFRGVCIRLFREWTGNIHWAVVISSLLFSAMHMQFYGFIPRFVLGLLLGYVFVWSANLWVPVIMHLINNGITVVASFLVVKGIVNADLETLGSEPLLWEVALSVLLTVVLLRVIFIRQKRLRLFG